MENLVCCLVGFPLRRFAHRISIINHAMNTEEKYDREMSSKVYIIGDSRVWVCSKDKLDRKRMGEKKFESQHLNFSM